jgi:hypothetical protein
MEFDPFGLSVKDLVTRSVISRYDSPDPLYTIPLRASPTSALATQPYALVATASPSTLHHRLGHPSSDILSMLSRTSVITCPRAFNHSLCHACQLGRHVRLPFPSSSSRAVQPFALIHCDKYYLVILDDCTHYSWTFLLHFKSNTFSTLSHFFAYIFMQFGYTIHSVQCDNG